jgi:ribosome-associated protein
VTSDGEKPSKTRRKKEVHALQDLGAELVELSEEQLAAIELPERLRDAVMEARSITKFEARRRQLQYIGKIMRRVDPGPIRAALDARRMQSRRHAAAHQRAEAWRERLLVEPGALEALLAEQSGGDERQLRALVREARHERDANLPPRAFRELYRVLRARIEGKH